MSWWSWRWIRPTRQEREVPTPPCRHCGARTFLCPACQGAWENTRCGTCGLGYSCPDHGQHWAL